ncbi:MAG: ABC transporter permease [Eubacteriales bacterium]|nr:ABC transporter permease [Eubacteriales bacterium]
MRLAFTIAVRFLRSGRGQTILIAIGIAIGVSVQIFIGSLIQGLQIELVDSTIGSQSQITISNKLDDALIDNYDKLEQDIDDNYESVRFVSATADGPALLSLDDDSYSILLRGLNFNIADGIYKITDKLEGNLPAKEGEVLIGTELKEEAEISLGDELLLLSGEGKRETMKVTGIFDLGVANLNKSWVLGSLPTAQNFFNYEDKATSIEMQLEDVFAADTLAAEIQAEQAGTLTVDNWKDLNASLLSGLNGQSVSSYMIQVFVMISVLLGIASVLAITVVQKSRQLGILKAMGIQDGQASLIFVFQGLMLGIAGAILGVLLGLGLSYAFTTFALNPDGTPVVPLYIDPGFIALSAAFAIVVSTIAALIPARRSSKLNPIEVIRNG